MKVKSIVIATAVLGLPWLAPPAFADNHDATAPLTDVWIVVPKQGMEARFEEALEKHAEFRSQAGDPRDWNVFGVVMGDRMNVYQIRYCCFDWADQDDYLATTEELGFEEHWNENVHEYVDHYHHYFETSDWENSYWPEEAGSSTYYGVTSWVRKQGAGPAPDAARERFSQIAKNEGWAGEDNQWLWLERIGGKPTLMLVSGFDDFADMAPPEQTFYEFMAERMDAAEVDEIFAQFGAGFSSSSYTVWTELENLSVSDDED